MGIKHREHFRIKFVYSIFAQRNCVWNNWNWSMLPANLIRMQVSSLQIQRFRRKIKRRSFTMAYFIKYFILINALIVSFCLIMSCFQVKNRLLTKSEVQLLDQIERRENIFEGKFILNPSKVEVWYRPRKRRRNCLNWRHRCWWRTLKDICVDNKFEMLVIIF